nr:hypothetical protein OG409_02695 [Streptomyces sp. NBC_00974]
MIDTGDIDVCPGLDVGKGEHHSTAVTPGREDGGRPCRSVKPRS